MCKAPVSPCKRRTDGASVRDRAVHEGSRPRSRDGVLVHRSRGRDRPRSSRGVCPLRSTRGGPAACAGSGAGSLTRTPSKGSSGISRSCCSSPLIPSSSALTFSLQSSWPFPWIGPGRPSAGPARTARCGWWTGDIHPLHLASICPLLHFATISTTPRISVSSSMLFSKYFTKKCNRSVSIHTKRSSQMCCSNFEA